MNWHWALLPACMVLGSFSFRVRGGLTEGWRYQLRGQVARLTWAVACGLTALAAGAVWWVALALVPLMWAAATLPLWDSIDMGRNQGTFARDFAVGTLHGLLMGACAAVLLSWAHYGCILVPGPAQVCRAVYGWFPLWWILLIGGAAWGACYALAWLKTDWPELRATRLGKYGQPPEAAELIFGAEFAAFLFFAASP